MNSQHKARVAAQYQHRRAKSESTPKSVRHGWQSPGLTTRKVQASLKRDTPVNGQVQHEYDPSAAGADMRVAADLLVAVVAWPGVRGY